ncbi:MULTISPECIES: hypothetical protein [unclassified Novosphingobium]|uniref:hypothetical protein n=1 Tax=unclassified Novosphingobium TaxID=2644732 RepID=UPI000D31D062|nr:MULTISPECIES: hypothetical protein [unclassified Novosphingobium]PTR06418.1 hypothetical protein C8K11_12031 [Novosphingobium sp. GV055]PUA94837.1 hypothetical protein C8K12_12031 [Novosphingobium sp. GV061]PUB13762.1 hypothetical protein C8K14_12031 [Novosphingobium sp. GV079]PUB38460.1 hypothetical protein C8K10_12031 [Novosphingobium sp. GV027]
MTILALDLSKRGTGWAVWIEGTDAPRYGSWVLGSEFTTRGQTYAKLHANLLDLRALCRFEHLYFEEPISPAQLSGHTNIDTLRVLSGLAAHAESFAHAMGLRTAQAINVSSWRGDFIGRIAASDARKRAKAANRSASDSLKALTIERCRHLGFKPRTNDEADALGLLDYACGLRGLTPPWRQNEVLRPMLTGSVRR